MKSNQTDLSKLLTSNDSDEKSEYEKKLALARSFLQKKEEIPQTN